jgi:hypothetical protein
LLRYTAVSILLSIDCTETSGECPEPVIECHYLPPFVHETGVGIDAAGGVDGCGVIIPVSEAEPGIAAAAGAAGRGGNDSNGSRPGMP